MHDVVRHKIVLQHSKKRNLCIQNADDTAVSIILAFNHFEINHNGACVPTSRQDSYLPDFVDYYSGTPPQNGRKYITFPQHGVGFCNPPQITMKNPSPEIFYKSVTSVGS